jgi:hypothetical protein
MFSKLFVLAWLAFAVPAWAAEGPRDPVSACPKAAAQQAGMAEGDVKVLGKHKTMDSKLSVDFRLKDGRVGACRYELNGTPIDVKLEPPAAK